MAAMALKKTLANPLVGSDGLLADMAVVYHMVATLGIRVERRIWSRQEDLTSLSSRRSLSWFEQGLVCRFREGIAVGLRSGPR